MRKHFFSIWEMFNSGVTTIILLFLFLLAIGSATFIEHFYDTFTAQKLIYKSIWLELLLGLLVLNFLGSIWKNNLIGRGLWASLIVHFGFIIIILGAGVTRYFGWDGEMHIREGHSSDVVYVGETALSIKIKQNNIVQKKTVPLLISQLGGNDFNIPIELTTDKKITVGFHDYAYQVAPRKSVDLANIDDQIILEILLGTEHSKISLKKGDLLELNGVEFSFNKKENSEAIQLYNDAGLFVMKSPYDLIATMRGSSNGVIRKDSIIFLEENNVFNTQKGLLFQIKDLIHGKEPVEVLTQNEDFLDALSLSINFNDRTHIATVLGGDKYIARDTVFSFDDLKVTLAYGYLPQKLPFSITLDKFILERYPGSDAPSNYSSLLTIVDPIHEVRSNFTVSKNKILDYGGYRFFQLSYDSDEKGTILSVNHDFYGTLISYIGYGVLILGFILLFFSKNSRLSVLPIKAKVLRENRETSR